MKRTCLFLLSFICLFSQAEAQIDLSGTWQFALDRKGNIKPDAISLMRSSQRRFSCQALRIRTKKAISPLKAKRPPILRALGRIKAERGISVKWRFLRVGKVNPSISSWNAQNLQRSISMANWLVLRTTSLHLRCLFSRKY